MCRNIDDVDKTMDEINEQTENMKQIQDALSAPIGSAADFDEVVISSLIFFLFFLGITSLNLFQNLYPPREYAFVCFHIPFFML